MSRVARNPVVIPAGVEATIDGGQISVKGPLGTLTQALSKSVKVEKLDGRLEFAANDKSIPAKAMSGTMRALVANMVHGVSKGLDRKSVV